ncbi:MAG: hypothetical protein D6729_18555 [Deltaproteobacteria bacterium]|nr:MAG: hypothetical protein D6729_18555 [Deltaproteobacteria bacterium]
MIFNISMKTTLLTTTLGLALLTPTVASAMERLFTYSYETGTLNAGDLELEPWTTVSAGKETHFLRMDQRFEFELGITDRFQTAWYVHFRGESKDVTDDSGQTTRTTKTAFKGVSLELKYQFLDPVADVLGLALYTELYLQPAETKVEAKLLLDKHIGDLVLVANLVGEYELGFESPGATEGKTELYLTGGAAYRVTSAFAFGLEVRSKTEIPDGEGVETSVIHAGPALSYRTQKWWISGTLLPQVIAVGGENAGRVDLEHATQLEARLLIGLHI